MRSLSDRNLPLSKLTPSVAQCASTPLSEPARILFVHSSAELYGSDRACLAMAKAAAASGFATYVLLPCQGPLVPLLRSAGCTVYTFDPLVLRRADLHGLRLLLVIPQWLSALVRLYRFSRRTRADLVHSNCMPTLGGAFLARSWQVPHIWHVHEIFSENRIAAAFFERLLRTADVILAASGAVVSQFRSSSLRQKARVAYTGASVPKDVKRTVPLQGEVPEVICVGRISGWKGQRVLIQAVGQLRDHGTKVRLTLVGDVFRSEHHSRKQLEELVTALGLERQVAFLGERRDALDLIGRADIVVVPSLRAEPFGMVIVEAMALGRPVIATSAGGPLEIVTPGYDGLLVAPGDEAALAEAIAGLIEHPDEGRRLGENAIATAARFTPEGMTQQVLSAYRQALSQHAESPHTSLA